MMIDYTDEIADDLDLQGFTPEEIAEILSILDNEIPDGFDDDFDGDDSYFEDMMTARYESSIYN